MPDRHRRADRPQGADYAPALKDNHPTLHAEVAATFADARATPFADAAPSDHDTWRTSEQDHGRLETRRYRTIRDPATIAYRNQGGAWAGLRAIGMVERQRRVGEALSSETRYYLLSGAGDATSFGHAWLIENRVHWVLDVAFREDESRVRVGHGAGNLAVLRHFALNLLREERATKGSIATKRFRAALDDTSLLAILAGLHH